MWHEGPRLSPSRGVAILTELVVILVLVLANGVFSGAEIALLSVRKTRIAELVETGSRAARAVLHLRDNPERLLATVQIGITVVSSTAAAFGGASIAQRFVPLLAEAGLAPRTAERVAFGAVVGLVSYLSLVLGELVPKSLALRAAEPYSLLIGRPLNLLSRVMRPVEWLLTASSNLVLRVFGDKTSFTESRLSADELQQMVEEAAEQGSVHPRTGDIASRAFELADLSVADVMVPRRKVVGLERGAPPQEVKRVLLEAKHSRLPVYDGSLDNVVGYVLARDLLGLALEQELALRDDAIQPPFFVPQMARAVNVMQQLQARRLQLAIVVDESGGLAGIVTMEDLLEELVGDIFSEKDRPREMFQREEDGSVVVDGSVTVRELNRGTGMDLPVEGDWTTIAGLVMALANAIPPTGARFTTEDGSVLEVVEASARRVKRVRVRRPAPPVEESPEGAPGDSSGPA